MSPQLTGESLMAWTFYNNPRQPYDDFVANYILKPLKFSVIKEAFDRPLQVFAAELPELIHRLSTIFGPPGDAWFGETIAVIRSAGIQNLYDFLEIVRTRSQAEGWISAVGLPQYSLMAFLDYLKQWWFPFPATLRELVEAGDPVLDQALVQLKANKIANCLTMLEASACPEKRADLAHRTGIPEMILLDLANRADVSRLPYTSGGAVKRLWVMGYRSLSELRHTDPHNYQARIEKFFAEGGKGFTFDAQMPHIETFLLDARHSPVIMA